MAIPTGYVLCTMYGVVCVLGRVTRQRMDTVPLATSSFLAGRARLVVGPGCFLHADSPGRFVHAPMSMVLWGLSLILSLSRSLPALAPLLGSDMIVGFRGYGQMVRMDGRIDVQNAASSPANSLATDARETISKDYQVRTAPVQL